MAGIQPIGQDREDEDLDVRQQALQSQLLLMKSAADAVAPEAIQAVEEELEQVSQDLNRQPSGQKAYPQAMDRLKGQRDTYVPGERGGEKLRTVTDRVDGEIRSLKKEVEELRERAESSQDPAEAEKLQEQLRSAEEQLRQKDNDTYRRRYAQYFSIGL